MIDVNKVNLDSMNRKQLVNLLNQCNKELDSLLEKQKQLKAEDRTDYAQNIMDKLFSTFKNGAKWTDEMKHNAEKLGYVYSPLGRMRHLSSAVLINPKQKQIINKQVRRGSNAPIQGFASELAVKASRLTLKAYYKELPVLCEMLNIDKSAWLLQAKSARIVHDASYYQVPYEMVLPFIQITQYMATYGVAKDVEDKFGLKFNIEPEVEFETASRDDAGLTWNYDIPNLLSNLNVNIKQQVELGIVTNEQEIRDKVFAPWMNKKVVKYLDKKYPLLNVHLAKKIYTDTCKAYKEFSSEYNIIKG